MTPLKTKDFDKEFVEKGAVLEHDRWARWQKWCHKVLRENCPSPELEKVLERWDRQIATPYSELSEVEKESDRKETRNYLPLLHSQLEKILEEVMKCVPEEREADSYIKRCSCGVDDCQGQCIGEFNSCREQTIKNLEDLIR